MFIFLFNEILKCTDLTFLVWAHMGHTTLWVVYGATSFVYNNLCTWFTLFFFYRFSRMESCCSLGLNLFKSVSWLRGQAPKCTFIPPPTDHNRHNKKLATPPYFYRDWNWQRLPGPMATDTRLSQKGWTNVPLAVAPMSAVGKHEKILTPVGKFPVCRFELRHCSLFCDLHI